MKFTSLLLLISFLSISANCMAEDVAPFEKAVAALEQGQTKQAIELFEAQQDDPDALVYLARIYMDIDLDDAEDWIKKALKKQPDNASVQYWKGRVMGAQAQNSVFSALSYAGKSLDGFTEAVKLEPSSVQYRNALLQFHIQAPRIAGGDIEIAKLQIEKIKQLDAKAGMRAEIDFAFSQDNMQQGQDLLKTAKQTFSDLPDFFFTAGMIQQRQENYDAAIAEFTQAIDKQANAEESIRARFNALYQLGRTAVLSESHVTTGIQALEQYIDQAPEMAGISPKPWAQFRLANLLALNNQKNEAKAIYLKLKDAPDTELAKKAKKAAKKI